MGLMSEESVMVMLMYVWYGMVLRVSCSNLAHDTRTMAGVCLHGLFVWRDRGGMHCVQ